MKDCNGTYGKSYLQEYKHGVAWRAHLENMRILRELWFNLAELETRRFLHGSFKTTKTPSKDERIHQEKYGCRTNNIVSLSPSLQLRRYHVMGNLKHL